jgi:pimeloyl-ACP methyl ester carboxylesterase
MLHWKEQDVAVNGLRLHVYRAGDEARPAVVLSHGVTDSGLCWPDVAPALAEAYHVVAYDARNHGRSGHTSEVYGWEELGDDEAGLIRALGLERVALVGHSMGAGTAAACAARHPELVRCAVLEDPPWMNTPPAPPPGATDRGAAYRKLQAMSAEELVAQARRDTPCGTRPSCRPGPRPKDSSTSPSPNSTGPRSRRGRRRPRPSPALCCCSPASRSWAPA